MSLQQNLGDIDRQLMELSGGRAQPLLQQPPQTPPQMQMPQQPQGLGATPGMAIQQPQQPINPLGWDMAQLQRARARAITAGDTPAATQFGALLEMEKDNQPWSPDSDPTLRREMFREEFMKKGEQDERRMRATQQGNFALDLLETQLGRTKARGPVLGRIPMGQLAPERMSYRSLREGSGNQIAYAINPQRVTDLDARWAIELVPKDTDTEKVANRKFNNLRLLISSDRTPETKTLAMEIMATNPNLSAKQALDAAESGEMPEGVSAGLGAEPGLGGDAVRNQLKQSGFSDQEINEYMRLRGL